MDQEVKERLISRVNTNPYVNHLGIDFTVVEEEGWKPACPCMMSNGNIAALFTEVFWQPLPTRLPVLLPIRCCLWTATC